MVKHGEQKRVQVWQIGFVQRYQKIHFMLHSYRHLFSFYFLVSK